MRHPSSRFLQTFSLLIGALALVFSSAGLVGASEHPEEAPSPGNSAADLVLTVGDDCETVTVSSDKDISNVKFLDGSTQIAELEEPAGSTFDVPDGATSVSAKSGTTERTAQIDCALEETEEPPAEETPVPDEGEETPVPDDGDDTDGDGQGPGSNAGDDAEVVVDFECVSVEVSSSKDLSNVVLVFADGTTERFEGLSGSEGSFAGTGENDGKVIETIYVKSGNNASGEGPGYGEGFDNTAGDCELTEEEPVEETPVPDEDSDEGDDTDVEGDDTVEETDSDSDTDVEGDEVVQTPVTPATPAEPGVNPATPASPTQPAVEGATDRDTQVLGAQTVRTLPRTGDENTYLAVFGLGLVLLGFGLHVTSTRLRAARTG